MRVNIPEFDEDTLNPKGFIDWLVSIEKVFEFKEVPENKRDLLIITKLQECNKARKRTLFVEPEEWDDDGVANDDYVEALVFDDDQYEEEVVTGDVGVNLMGKVCTFVVDSGSCDKLIAEEAVQKLGLKTKNRPKPYKLQWLKKSGERFFKSVVLMLKEFALMPWIKDRVFGYIKIPGQVPEPARLNSFKVLDKEEDERKFIFSYGVREAIVETKDGALVIPNVYYTPKITMNVLSIEQLENQGYIMTYDRNRYGIRYMFDNEEGMVDAQQDSVMTCEDSTSMVESHNKFLEEYFESIDPTERIAQNNVKDEGRNSVWTTNNNGEAYTTSSDDFIVII
nr:bulb-type lectin domain-containing protein [Tanacetum cinerariifolium]